MAGKLKDNTCIGCSAPKECKDTAASWLFLFIGLIATISIRLVNLVLQLDPVWPKALWYIGVGGFFVYFLYKFRQYKLLQKMITSGRTSERIASRQKLEEEDYEFIDDLFCQLKSKKDSINYFFIFSTSGLVLLLALYQDFLSR